MRVLLVDDEEELVATLAERLEMRGIRARWAGSAETAMALLDREAFDIAVLDVKIPKIDGLALQKRIQEAYPQMKFIFVTGHGSARDFESGTLEVGADYYLVKPLKIENLIAKFNEILKSR